MNPVLRAFSAKIEDVDQKDRAITAKISTNAIDRYNTCFEVRGCDLKAYNLNPVVLFEHGKDVNRGSLPIGRNVWIRVDKGNTPKLIARTKFKADDFSQQLYEAYRDGEMSGWSISALPSDFGKPTEQEIRSRPELADVDLVFRKFELCEYSAVAVPGNAECLTEDELRSFSKLISRGIPVPDDVQKAIDRLADESRVQVVVPADIVTLTDVEAPAEEPAVEPVIQEDASESRDVPETEDRASDAKCKDDDEDEDEDEADDEDHEDDKEDKKNPKGKDKPKDEDRSVIELPPLVGARTFQQVYHSLVQEENEFRSLLLRRMQEHIDWLHGKV